jgi:hypothetical protein
MTISLESTNIVIVHKVAGIPSTPVNLYNNGCTVYAGVEVLYLLRGGAMTCDTASYIEATTPSTCTCSSSP